MSLYDDIEQALDAVITKYKESAGDGLSMGEVFTLAANAVATLVQLTEKYGGYSGDDKKEAVIKALGRVYDEVIEPIDIKQIPNFLEGMFDKFAKQLLMTLAESWIESLVNIFNKTGWGNGGQTPAPTPSPEVPQGPSDDKPSDFVPY
jgi:hypothetical protein